MMSSCFQYCFVNWKLMMLILCKSNEKSLSIEKKNTENLISPPHCARREWNMFDISTFQFPYWWQWRYKKKLNLFQAIWSFEWAHFVTQFNSIIYFSMYFCGIFIIHPPFFVSFTHSNRETFTGVNSQFWISSVKRVKGVYDRQENLNKFPIRLHHIQAIALRC